MLVAQRTDLPPPRVSNMASALPDFLCSQALCINVGEILNDYGIYAMFHELLREAGGLYNTLTGNYVSIIVMT